MTYHQTLNIPITLGRRPTSGKTRRTFKEATGTAKQGENKDIAKPFTEAVFLEDKSLGKGKQVSPLIPRRPRLPGTQEPRHSC